MITIGKATLHNIDCMELLKATPDKFYDLAIVDPPYFEDYSKKNYTGSDISTTGIKRQTNKINHWDIPNEIYFNELFRVSKNQIIWGCNYYQKFIPAFGRIVWDKKNDTSTFSKAELASHSFGLRVDMFRYEWNGMLQGDMKNKENRIHPTQKPVKLYEWLLTNYAKQGDKILDTHCGSGSIAIACNNLSFDLTACELDKDYFDASVKRIQQANQQIRMFA
ncbi:MAG: DNA methyltransferase [Pseudomonadota bacterium]